MRELVGTAARRLRRLGPLAVFLAIAAAGLAALPGWPLPWAPPPARAADPVVSNVLFAQRTDGSGLVDVTYDLADTDGDSMTVTLLASENDGASWDLPCLQVSGDVGPGVRSGTGRHIVWNFGGDNPGRQLAACRVRVVASDLGVPFFAHSPRHYAIIDWLVEHWTPEMFERYARADLIVLTANYYWADPTNESLRVLDRIRAINPDCKIIGYVLGKTSMVAWENPGNGAFGHTWWQRTRPYWCWTTTGDTVQDWQGQVNINILEPGCREAMASTIAEFQRNSNNKFDGVFWDYFNKALWIGAQVTMTGLPDLDGDGIGHWSDPDELAAYRAAEVSLVQAVQDSLGPDFIQIFNGQRAYADSAFAALGDGMFYEVFPEIFFPQPQTLRYALDPAWPYNLFRTNSWPRSRNGGPYNIYGNTGQNRYYDTTGQLTEIKMGNTFRALGLLTDGWTCWTEGGNWRYGWTNIDIPLGQPLGPTVIDGDLFTRDYQYGRVEVLMTSYRYPDPCDYKIWVNGRLVEQLAIPYHFP